MNFTAEQQDAISAIESNRLAITACPGAGKTHTLVGCIQSAQAPANQIVAITFTNSAAEELRQRLLIKIGFVGTLHCWLFECLRKFWNPRLKVIDEETAQSILDETVETLKYTGTVAALREALLDVSGALGTAKPSRGAPLVAAAYHQRLRADGLIDFDGILGYGLALMRGLPGKKEPSPPMVGEYLFVDEAQDSGAIDWEIYRAARFRHKIAVGDFNQSIFAFRGAQPQGLRLWGESGDARRLTVSRRCRAKICEAANRLIPSGMTALQPGGWAVSRSATDEAAMLQSIASECAGHPLLTRAVLCRANWQCDAAANALRGIGITVRLLRDVSRQDLPSDWRMARLAVAFLAEPDNDQLAYQMLCRTRGAPEAKFIRRKALMEMQTINQTTLRLRAMPPLAALDALGRLTVARSTIEAAAGLLEGLTAQKQEPTMSDLEMAMAEHEREAARPPADPGAVTVSTIHGAKGREWDEVFLPYWADELFPGRKTGDTLDEERRLAYVAVTRARESVVITWAKKCRSFGAANVLEDCHASRFIAEMGL